MTKFLRAGIALAVVSVLGWLVACSDHPGGPIIEPQVADSLIVSDPVLPGVASGTGAASARESSTEDGVAYVSLPPGAVPTGSRVSIRRVGDAAFVTTAVLDGGFDPVAVPANAGDVIEVRVTNASGGTVLQQLVAVAAARPPIVVRTQPPRRKTDVPLNAAIVIVFSEPVAGGTLTSTSVQLFRGTAPVDGTVRLLEGTGGMAAFVPASALDANTDYQLVVTEGVKDLDGDALARRDTVSFTTGQALAGPPASIRLSLDSMLSIAVGATYQLTAMVLDSGGNVLVDQPITWSTSDPSVVTVSATGLITAIEPGTARVTATVDGLSNGLWVSVPAGPPASLVITPTTATIGAGDTIHLTATIRDADGHQTYSPVAWTSSAPAVATVTSSNPGTSAVVKGVSEGSVTITATSGAASDTVSIAVGPTRPVASVTIVPGSLALIVHAWTRLVATLQDADGKAISSRPITWMSDNPAVATVDTAGRVAGISLGSAALIATSEGVSDTATITVQTISFVSVSAGGPDDFPSRYPPLGIPGALGAHTCGLTSDGSAYCWGGAAVRWADLPESEGYPTEDWWYLHLDFGVPLPVPGDLRFVTLVTGADGSVGRTADGTWYRWRAGGASYGETPTGPLSRYPTNTVAVALPKARWDAYSTYHDCYLTTDGAAYCSSGPVADGHTFSTVGVGAYHTCGLTTTGIAYCWHANDPGQVPVAVAGGLSFTALSVGAYHSCALSTTNAAYCWGGLGTSGSGSVPLAVGGGLSFGALTVGEDHSCALTAGGAAYCWGANAHGQLGDGSTTESSVPVAVVGGLTFSSLSAGSQHTCGITAAGIAYCWGWNNVGQLGDGSRSRGDIYWWDAYSSVPVKVAGQP